MKKLLVVMVLALVVPKVGSAGDDSFGIRGGMSIPNGTFQDPSGYFDLVKTIGFKDNKTMSMAFGASFANFKYFGDPIVRIAGSVGPQILLPLTSAEKTTSLYLLPAISGGPIFRVESGSDKTWRWGLDLGAGLMIPVGSSNQQFEIGGIFSLTNLIKKRTVEEEYDWDIEEYVGGKEPSINLINIHIGFIF
ncbi:MAG: hypothetical protein EXS58_14730 [Candidatus Latescibacteria bacterium]|nr:hypothetical protein [Candidatus Latescibacterota bacterium]